MTEVKVLAISGSLRARSYNTALALAARTHAPSGVGVTCYDGLRDIPPFDEDYDTEAALAPVADLRRRISEADALLIVTPEYNGSMPGVLKNALDWASRPSGRSALDGKTVALAGASTSQFGTVRAQLALRQMFASIGATVLPQPEVLVFRAQDRFDDGGNLTDPFSISLLQDLLRALAARSLQPA